MEATGWNGFVGGKWQKEVNVRDFIQKNYTPYDGDESFLAAPTERTLKVWDKLKSLMEQERANQLYRRAIHAFDNQEFEECVNCLTILC